MDSTNNFLWHDVDCCSQVTKLNLSPETLDAEAFEEAVNDWQDRDTGKVKTPPLPFTRQVDHDLKIAARLVGDTYPELTDLMNSLGDLFPDSRLAWDDGELVISTGVRAEDIIKLRSSLVAVLGTRYLADSALERVVIDKILGDTSDED